MRLVDITRMSSQGRRMVVAALGWVMIIRAALWLVPFASVQRLVQRLGRRSPRALGPLTPQLVDNRAWAVSAVSRYVPGATCLTQALALQVLLARSGGASELRIGVSRGEEGFGAHAWLVCDGRIVIGDTDLERYVQLPPTRVWSKLP